MPVHDFRCQECQKVTSVLSYTWSQKSDPACRGCGNTDLTKLMSGFAFHRSWGESLNWAPSAETLTDVNEDSPQALDSFMGRIKQEMGGQVTPDFNEMRKEITDLP